MKFVLTQGKKFFRSGLFSALMLAVALVRQGLARAPDDQATPLGYMVLEVEEYLPLSPDILAAVKLGLEGGSRVVERIRLGKKGLEDLRQSLSAFARYLRGAEINTLLFLEKMGLYSDVH